MGRREKDVNVCCRAGGEEDGDGDAMAGDARMGSQMARQS